ncbi:MAG TPA: DNA-binding protein WhiA [Candidatus Limnocylindria bacterium]|nr:DNA-binding protein WhiA [Candidatus Limnocylindria bacterium]
MTWTDRPGRGGPSGDQRPERDLVAAVRAELAAVEPARRCCRAAERAGLGSAAHGRARSPLIGRLAVRLEEEEAGVGTFAWEAAEEHCRMSFLRGLFLARGSLSLAGGRTHLELVVSSHELGPLAARLAGLGLPASARLRRGRGVLTWKNSETVLTFLRRAGGRAATLELEARVVTRTLRGHLNRVLNAENANLQRSVLTAHRQLASIAALESAGRLAAMPAGVQAVARARRRAPEQTFSELARELGTSRAHVQRAFEQIESAALRLEGVAAGEPR